MKKLKSGKRDSKKTSNRENLSPPKFKLSADFYLGTSIGFFFTALSHIEEAIKDFQCSSSTYQYYMIVFIIFLCLAFLLLGIYFGMKDQHSTLNK